MAEIAPQLERWYGVALHIARQTLRTQELAFTLHNEAITQALDLVASLLQAHYERHGRVVTFSSS